MNDDRDESIDVLMLALVMGVADEEQAREARGKLDAGDAEALAAVDRALVAASEMAGSVEPVAIDGAAWRRLRDRVDPPGPISMPAPASERHSPNWPVALVAAALAAGAVFVGWTTVQRQDAQRRAVAAEALVEQLREDADKADAQADDAQVQRRELQQTIATLETELATVTGDLATTQAQRQKAIADLESLQRETSTVRQEAAGLRLTVARLEQQLEAQTQFAQRLDARLVAALATLDLALSADSQLASLAGTEARPDAGGVAVLNATADRLRLDVDGLVPPTPAQTYQAWALPAEGDPISLGTFAVGDDGRGTFDSELPDLPDALNAVAVSLEPAGGTPQPTGPIVLVGPLR
ncbi:MAG: anti-sigma factor [Planctomycetota bacterium]